MIAVCLLKLRALALRRGPGPFLSVIALLVGGILTGALLRSRNESHEYYVSPAGKQSGSGSSSDPWDLQTALSQPKSVLPGDTIWLRGGKYSGTFQSTLQGSPDKPIIVRATPGERPTIDTGAIGTGAGLFVSGSDSWFWGIEIMSSNPRRSSLEKGSAPSDLQRVPGVVVQGPRTKFINMVIHDTAGGYGFWSPAIDAEIYGNLLYYNGWAGPDRGHGHAIYSQNQYGKKRIEDNVAFSNFGMGIRAYGSEKAFANHIEFVGNVSFNAGLLYGDPPVRWANFFATVGKGAEDILFESNYGYHSGSANQGGSSLGWAFSDIEKNVTATNNYWIGGSPSIEVWNWNAVTFEKNVSYSEGGLAMLLNHRPEQDRSRYRWDDNTYYGSDLMRLNGRNLRWSQWQKETGLDSRSAHYDGRPKGNWVFVRPNKYERGRANIVIYNWDRRDRIAVNLNGVLTRGKSYEIRDVQNFYNPDPVARGLFLGNDVLVPMSGLSSADPVGVAAPEHTDMEFGAFVVSQGGAGDVATSR